MSLTRLLRLRGAQPTTPLAKRHFLSNWDAAEFDDLKYSYGLEGVDQVGNYLWVDTFLYLLVGISGLLLLLRISNMWWKHSRHLSAMGNSKQKYWEVNRTSWWPWLNRHVLMAPLWKKKHNAQFQISSAIDNGTLPGRWHTIMLVIYVALNVAWCRSPLQGARPQGDPRCAPWTLWNTCRPQPHPHYPLRPPQQPAHHSSPSLLR